jgi:UDP:flavonoid glycosyltransferase YjiC (YdhE family)
MKISIQTLGTRGDILPFLTLARALMDAGHTISLLAPRDYSALIRQFGVQVATPPAFSVSDWMQRSRARGTLRGPVRFFRDWPVMIRPHIEDVLERSLEAARGADLVLANPIAVPARIAAEHAGLPFILMALQPVITPTGVLPCAMIARRPMGPLLNQASYLAVSLALAGLAASLGKARRRLVPAPRPGFANLGRHLGEPLTRLTALPAALGVTSPADFDQASHLVDYPALQSPDSALSEPLAAFLASGQPPAYLGLGSMEVADSDALLASWLGRLEAAGQRAVIAASLAGHPPGPLGPHFVAGALPHDHLFPHCAAVIHHGGAGTLDTASRAGCPQIILPQVLDQFWNAHMLTARGVAGHARTPRPKGDEIDMLIGHALSDDTRRAARSLAASQPEPARAVQRIVGIIEQTAGDWRARAR